MVWCGKPYCVFSWRWINKLLKIMKFTVIFGNDRHACMYCNFTISGLRMLDQPYMTDIIEAQSMGYRQDLVDIYSASWGPTDDGKTADGPRKLTMRSIVKGVNEVCSSESFVNGCNTILFKVLLYGHWSCHEAVSLSHLWLLFMPTSIKLNKEYKVNWPEGKQSYNDGKYSWSLVTANLTIPFSQTFFTPILGT